MTMDTREAIAASVAISPMYPPSFADSPLLFGLALFSRLLIFSLSTTMIVRLMSRVWDRHNQVDHTGICIQMAALGMFWALFFGSGSDMVTWLPWGETSPEHMTILMACARALDALSCYPVILALTTPYWTRWAVGLRLLPQPVIVAPIRRAIGPIMPPRSNIVLCAMLTLGITFSKWWAYHGHISS